MNIYHWTLTWAHNARLKVSGIEETASTNADAKESLGANGPDLIVANHQTSGRGRGTNTWSEKPGEALLSSWIFKTKSLSPQSPQPVTSALVGLALFEAAKATWPKVSWALKAPNDLHVVSSSGCHKVAGLLIEVVSDTVIVGLGMNTTGAPTETKPYPAISLSSALEKAGEPIHGGSAIKETDWRSFLSNWFKACHERVAEGLVPNLKQSSCDALAAALARHPEFKDISNVEADGSLIFKNGRRISWTAL